MSQTLRYQFFDWLSEDHKCSGMFRVSSMLFAIDVGKLPYDDVLSYLDRNFVEQNLLALREPNVAYAKALTKAQYDRPVLGLCLPSGSVLLVDGTHRYIARYFANEELITYRMVAYPHWLPFALIKGDITCQ